MPDIQHSIEIASTPDAVYSLIASAKGFGQWWASDIIEHDGAVELAFFKRATVYKLRNKVDKPAVQSEWVCESGDQWKGTHIIFRLANCAAGTLLRFTHRGWATESDYFVSCNTTWGELMFRLKSAAEGKARGPLFSSDGMAY